MEKHGEDKRRIGHPLRRKDRGTDTAINKENRGVKDNPAVSPIETREPTERAFSIISSRSGHRLVKLQGQGEAKRKTKSRFNAGMSQNWNGPCILGNTEDPIPENWSRLVC
jgi:hypothetical protein